MLVCASASPLSFLGECNAAVLLTVAYSLLQVEVQYSQACMRRPIRLPLQHAGFSANKNMLPVLHA